MPTTQPCPKCSAQVPAGSRFCQVCGSTVADAKQKKGKSGSGSQTKFFVIGAVAIILVVAAVLAGLGSSSLGNAKPGSVAEVPGAGPIPDWLKNADPDIIADYAWAAQHYEELRYIPCYCGCGSVGHTSNATCYFRYDKGGKILGWDAHALGWGICIDITRDVRKGLEKGKTLTQIRNEIDKKYQAEGLKSTDTPMPPAGK